MKKKDLLQTDLKYKLLTECSQEIIMFFDQSGNIIEYNQPAIELLGCGEDIRQIPITDIFRKAIKYVNKELIINEKYCDKLAETVAYRKNQTCFCVNLRVTVNQDKSKFIGACLAIDMRGKKSIMQELRRTKQELKLIRQTKNEFVANISHELRTPVNGIMGLVDNLMETELTPKQLETVNIIHRCCNNMNTIINDLLDYTKIANNKMTLEQRAFCFRSFINNIVAFNINRISEKGLKLLVNVADDVPYQVIGDELRLTQILNNLFSNAIKFTSIGHIALEVVKTGQTDHEIELFFMLMDTGIGIALEEKDKLFRSFSQVDGSITRRFGGTGLGLSISKLLVEAMRGTITVESEKNKGSNFTFTVRLGISKSVEGAAMDELDDINNPLCQNEKIDDNKSAAYSSFHEFSYIEKILEKANVSPAVVQDINLNQEYQDANTKRISKELYNTMDRLMICIEMGSWGKAEDFATLVKMQVPEENKDLKNKALRLVLSVRKEDHDNSLTLLNELREMLNEVTGWKI